MLTNPFRRRFLRATMVSAPAVVVPLRARAMAHAPLALRFEHLHTGERLLVEHTPGALLGTDAMAAVNRLLRDFRTGEVSAIDTGLLDQLAVLAGVTGSRRPYEIISGYRSPATNAMLREHGGGVATRSLHMEGRAIDVRLADVPLAKLRDAALALGRGGVGYYPGSNFVHLDTGRKRHW